MSVDLWPTFDEEPHGLGNRPACEKPEGPYAVTDAFDVRCPACRLALGSLAYHQPTAVIDDHLEGDRVTVAEAFSRYRLVVGVAG